MSRSQQLIPAAMEPASDWYKPSHGWPSIMLSACLGGACTWLALAAWGGVEPHAGWRQSMRAVASARDSCAPQPWPASLRADPARADLTNATALVPVATLVTASGWSQGGEDLHAYNTYFYSMRDGVFLEMGALDGRVFSNTQLFEAFLGWKGVLVEPSPKSFEHLVINRPNSIQVNAAVCSTSTMVHYVDASTATSLRAINGVREFMSETFKTTWASHLDKAVVTEVPCLPLGKLLADLKLTHVNFFSLDVEGAELSVLETIDFQRVRFDVVVVEADGTNPVKDQQIVNMLLANGYVHRGFLNRNNWFIREGFVPSQRPRAS